MTITVQVRGLEEVKRELARLSWVAKSLGGAFRLL
jgi:hypothetical protein